MVKFRTKFLHSILIFYREGYKYYSWRFTKILQFLELFACLFRSIAIQNKEISEYTKIDGLKEGCSDSQIILSFFKEIIMLHTKPTMGNRVGFSFCNF